jgi:hypothetical protein
MLLLERNNHLDIKSNSVILIALEIIMMIYTRIQKSKVKKRPKAEREQYEKWLESHKPTKILKLAKTSNLLTGYKLSAPAGRETVRLPSLSTGENGGTKAAPKVYTGTKVVGIATMHKSNAVPVFSNEQAVEISKMRR